MAVGHPVPDPVNTRLKEAWEEVNNKIYDLVADFDTTASDLLRLNGIEGRIAHGIVNRLLPTTKMIRGIVTATESAWKDLLALRNHDAADSGMQVLARHIQALLDDTAIWRHSFYHVPFATPPVDTAKAFRACWKESAGMTARVSYGAPGPGQRSSKELADSLLLATPTHFSPFEHSAYWCRYPNQSALCSRPSDMHDDYTGVFGWENTRSMIELEQEGKKTMIWENKG